MASKSASRRQSQPDDSEPTPERQAELRAAHEKNAATNRAPCADVEIYTRGELIWLVGEHGWAAGPVADGKARANLSDARLDSADLSDVNLTAANLSGARLLMTNLSGADLYEADLSGGILGEANLSGTYLADANLSGTYLADANLSEADLYEANLNGVDLGRADLSGADLGRANLSGADLRQARLDESTVLRGVTLSPMTRLGDVVWNGAPLTQIDWAQAPHLGDELDVDKAQTRQERVRAYRDAARAYRGLALALREQGLLIPASGYRLREQRLERRALLNEGKLFAWLGSLLLDGVSGYGELPARAFRAYAAVVLGFAAIYFYITNFGGKLLTSDSAHLKWYEALVLSLSSFHGRGFFPSMLSLGDPLAIVAAFEAVIGLFIELVLIATFSRRFLGD